MKRNFILAGLLAASALIAACSDDEVSNPQAVPDAQPAVSSQETNIPETQGTHIVLHGVANGDASLQKTMLASDGKSVLFTKGDKVSLFDGADNNISMASDVSDDGTTADFSGEIKQSAANYYILYPYQSGASISDGGNSSRVISANLPANQTATPNSFDPAANLSAAISEGSDEFALKNIGSLLKFTTTEAFSKIVVKSANTGTEASPVYPSIAGNCTITFDADGNPDANPADDAVSSITLGPADNGDIAAGTYYVALLPVTLDKGLIIEFYQKNSSGTEIKTSDTYKRFQPKKEGEKGLTFERCKGKNCGELLTANGVYIDMVKVAAAGNVTNDFSIGRFEVTQALWYAVMGENPSNFKEKNPDGTDNNYSILPIENVPYSRIVDNFLPALNTLTQKEFRLPKIDEWQLAFKGGNPDNTNGYSGSNSYDEVAWHRDNSYKHTHIVGSKKPNELGIYDMSGNVGEYVSEWNGSFRLAYGGDYRYNAWEHCHVYNRWDCNDQEYTNNGFRLAL